MKNPTKPFRSAAMNYTPKLAEPEAKTSFGDTDIQQAGGATTFSAIQSGGIPCPQIPYPTGFTIPSHIYIKGKRQ